jgi:GNAT superfamily N-acetyltransferase
MIEIRSAVTQPDLEMVRGLLREYFEWLDRDLGVDIRYQGPEKELAALPGPYAPPAGVLLLALLDGQPAGCAAIKPQESGGCLMKRMYVRPVCRGQGVAKALGRELIRAARACGYPRMQLGTMDVMEAAQGLYTYLGFQVVQPYQDVPTEIGKHTVFMELDLSSPLE